ncbi:MAG TPA: DUF1318 domain-containing protein [bacterium]|nr:DUF1318 domain-containing protein [bacterium]HPO07882.1 DUF1318 domain-containing protein [bacterium]HQO37098.1 DUF1318 domain-containing protein [bacterium]HQP99242.1 DUF1318 domain-containing protein [bacterium]
MPHITRRFAWLALLIMGGCVNLTVNVYFPASEIRSALEDIESDIRDVETPPSSQATFEHPLWSCLPTFRLSFGPTPAYAQTKINLDVETPTILAIKKQRKVRFKEIDPILAKGVFGEGRIGYLVIRKQEGLSLKEKADLKKLLEEENADRKKMYLAILTENSLPKEELPRVEKLAAEAIRKVMKPGRWYEVEKDQWIEKKEEKEAPK